MSMQIRFNSFNRTREGEGKDKDREMSYLPIDLCSISLYIERESERERACASTIYLRYKKRAIVCRKILTFFDEFRNGVKVAKRFVNSGVKWRTGESVSRLLVNFKIKKTYCDIFIDTSAL